MKLQVSETVTGTKFAPSYACIFRENVENKFSRVSC